MTKTTELPLVITKWQKLVLTLGTLLLGVLVVFLPLMTFTGGRAEKDLLNYDSNDCSFFQILKSLTRQDLSRSLKTLNYQMSQSCSALVFCFFSFNNKSSGPAKTAKFHFGVRAGSIVLFLFAAPLTQSYTINAMEYHLSASVSDPILQTMDHGSTTSYTNDKIEPPVIGSTPIRIYISFHQSPLDSHTIKSKQEECGIGQSINDNIYTETEYEVHVLEIPRRSTLSSYDFTQGIIKPRAPEHAYEPFISSETILLQRNQEEFDINRNPIRHTVNVPKRQCVNTRGIPIAHSICHQRYYVKIWKIDWDINDDGSRTVISRRLLRYDSGVKKYADFSPVYIHFKLPVERRSMHSNGSEDEKFCAKKVKSASQVLMLMNLKANATIIDETFEAVRNHGGAYCENEKEVHFTSAQDKEVHFETIFTTREGKERHLEHESQTLQGDGTQSDLVEWIILCILFGMTVVFLLSVRYISNGYIHFDHRAYFYFLLDFGSEVETVGSGREKHISNTENIGAGERNEINARIVFPRGHGPPVEYADNDIVVVCDQEFAMDDLSNSVPRDSFMQYDTHVASTTLEQEVCIDLQRRETAMQCSIDCAGSICSALAGQGGCTDSKAKEEVVTAMQNAEVEYNVGEIESPPSIDRKVTCSNFCLLQIQDSFGPGHEGILSLDNKVALITIGTLPHFHAILPQHSGGGLAVPLRTTNILETSVPKPHEIKPPSANDSIAHVQISLQEQTSSNSNSDAVDFPSSSATTSVPFAHDSLNSQCGDSLCSTHGLQDIDITSCSRSIHPQKKFKSPPIHCDNSDHVNIGLPTQPLEKYLSTMLFETECSPIRSSQNASSCTNHPSESVAKKKIDDLSQTVGTCLDFSLSHLERHSTTYAFSREAVFFESDQVTPVQQLDYSANNLDGSDNDDNSISCPTPSDGILASPTHTARNIKSFTQRSDLSLDEIDTQSERHNKAEFAADSSSDPGVASPDSNHKNKFLHQSQLRKRKHDVLEASNAAAPVHFDSSSKLKVLMAKREADPSYEEDYDSKAGDVDVSAQHDEKEYPAIHGNCEVANTTGDRSGVSLGTKAVSTTLKKPSESVSLEAISSDTTTTTNTQVNNDKYVSGGSNCVDDALPNVSYGRREVGAQNENDVPLPGSVNANSESTASFVDTGKRSTTSLVFDFEVISTEAICRSPISRSSCHNIRELHQDTPETSSRQDNSVKTTIKRPAIPRVPDPVPSKGLLSLSQEFQDPVWEFSGSAMSPSRETGTKRKLRDVSNHLDSRHSKRSKRKTQQSISKRSNTTSESDINKLRGSRKRKKRSSPVNVPSEILLKRTKDAGSAITAPRFHCKEKGDKSQQGSIMQSSQSSRNATSNTSSSKSSRVY